ncbi:MAG: replicative DNA helicase [Verrucomicrobia bacterium]|nr:MAG: replicative DNA helicase [Verrucomicrobiota bacterium]
MDTPLKDKGPRSRKSAQVIDASSEFSSAGAALRVPPHSIECEQALLACCIFEGGQESITACIEAKVEALSFYKPAHQTIYQVFLELYKENSPVDEVILSDRLKAKGLLEVVGGEIYINEITNRIQTPVHLPYYVFRVRDLALVRRLIRTSVQTIEQAYADQENVEEFLESVEREIFKISEGRITESAKPLKDSIDGATALVHKMIQNKGALTGISTGFADLDKITSGLHPQEMIVIAARPSMGKTSIALNIAEAAITANDRGKNPVPILLFSLEMSAEQLAMRLLCSYGRVDMQRLRDGFLDKQAETNLARSAKVLKNAPLWIDDSGHITMLEMRAKARRLHAQKSLGLIIIDYLQLVAVNDSRVPREQQISEISRGIKSMAKELNVPVIVAAQLNRESEKEKRQPRLSDLRESGAIEQDADLVLLISRKKDFDEQQEVVANIVPRDLIVAKQRNGSTGTVPLMYNKRLTRFENYSSEIDTL